MISTSPEAAHEIHALVRWVVDTHCSLKKGVVLDVAAGNGYMTEWLLQHGFEVTPMDKNTTQWRLPEVPCLECDLNKGIKAGANNYDMVVSIETIEHLENPFHFIREVARVMKPKGIAIITTPNVHSIRSRLKYLFLGLPYLFEYVSDDHMGQHISPISIGHFLYAFRQAGMKIVDIYSTGPQSPFYLQVVFRILENITYVGAKYFQLRRKSEPDHYLSILSDQQLRKLNRHSLLLVMAVKT